MNKCKSLNVNINFIPDEYNLDEILKTIKNFGKIVLNHFKFKKCPENINQSRAYKVSGEYDNILTKTGTDGEWMGTITEKELDKSTEYLWKIKVFESKFKKRKADNEIMIGVAPIDFDINSSMYTNCGWYYCLDEDSLYSGPPHNYNCFYTKKKTKREEHSSDSEEDKPKKKAKKKKDESSDSEDCKDKKICKKKKILHTKKNKPKSKGKKKWHSSDEESFSDSNSDSDSISNSSSENKKRKK